MDGAAAASTRLLRRTLLGPIENGVEDGASCVPFPRSRIAGHPLSITLSTSHPPTHTSMAQLSIPASSRTAVGKGPNRRLRATGMIPAVVYGGAGSARALAVSPRQVTEIVRSPRGVNTILSLEIDGEESVEKVMIHDYQLHPLDHSVLHADLMRVDTDKASDWHVPVRLEGESAGVKRGGNLDFVTRFLVVSCLPRDIPEFLPLVVTELDYGDTVRAADIDLPERLSLASERDVVIVHVSPPKGTDEPEEEDEIEVPEE